MTKRDSAVTKLRASGVPVQSTDYGFKILHEEGTQGSFAECGMDNDSSISLSVTREENPPVAWFFRIDYGEMAEFILQSYAQAGGPDAPRSAIIAAMNNQNEGYDDTKLKLMTEAFLSKIET